MTILAWLAVAAVSLLILWVAVALVTGLCVARKARAMYRDAEEELLRPHRPTVLRGGRS